MFKHIRLRFKCWVHGICYKHGIYKENLLDECSCRKCDEENMSNYHSKRDKVLNEVIRKNV